MEPAFDVVLVRHGETEWSKLGRHTGRSDIPLTDEGRRTAAGLKPALAGWNFSRVLSSPLRRASETCRIAGLADRMEVDPDLQEWDYGQDEGRTSLEIQADRPGWRIWDTGPKGGEAIEQVAERADRVIQRLLPLKGHVAIFAHGHLLRIFAARWLGEHPRLAGKLVLGTAAISVLSFEHQLPALIRWNDLTHLAR
jgi:broad specificity phosphatase PhoE